MAVQQPARTPKDTIDKLPACAYIEFKCVCGFEFAIHQLHAGKAIKNGLICPFCGVDRGPQYAGFMYFNEVRLLTDKKPFTIGLNGIVRRS